MDAHLNSEDLDTIIGIAKTNSNVKDLSSLKRELRYNALYSSIIYDDLRVKLYTEEDLEDN